MSNNSRNDKGTFLSAEFSSTAMFTDGIGAIVDHHSALSGGGNNQLPSSSSFSQSAMMIGGAIGTTSGTTAAANTMPMDAAGIEPAACWWLDSPQQQHQSFANFGAKMTAAQPFQFVADWTAASAMAPNGAGDFNPSVHPHCGDTTAMANSYPSIMHQPQQQQQQAESALALTDESHMQMQITTTAVNMSNRSTKNEVGGGAAGINCLWDDGNCFRQINPSILQPQWHHQQPQHLALFPQIGLESDETYNTQNHWEPRSNANANNDNGHHNYHIPTIIHCSVNSATATAAIPIISTTATTTTATAAPPNYAATSSISSLAPSAAVFDYFGAVGQWPLLAATDFSSSALATDDIGAIVDHHSALSGGGIHQLPQSAMMIGGGAIGTTSGSTAPATTMAMDAAEIQSTACWWLDPQQQHPQSVGHFSAGMTAAYPFLFEQQAADVDATMVYNNNNSGNNHPSHFGPIPTIMHCGQQQQQQFSADQFLPQLHHWPNVTMSNEQQQPIFGPFQLTSKVSTSTSASSGSQTISTAASSSSSVIEECSEALNQTVAASAHFGQTIPAMPTMVPNPYWMKIGMGMPGGMMEMPAGQMPPQHATATVTPHPQQMMNTTATGTLPTSSHEHTAVNKMGRRYVKGRRLPEDIRNQIVQLGKQKRVCAIARQMNVSHSCVSKILGRFKEREMLESLSRQLEEEDE